MPLLTRTSSSLARIHHSLLCFDIATIVTIATTVYLLFVPSASDTVYYYLRLLCLHPSPGPLAWLGTSFKATNPQANIEYEKAWISQQNKEEKTRHGAISSSFGPTHEKSIDPLIH